MRSVGANVFFCVPGMQIDPLLSAIDQDSNLEIVVASHECGAAFMADGYARLSQRYGACGSIGGPGTSNLLSGMMTATAHSTPIFYVTGNAPSKFESLGAFQNDDWLEHQGESLLGQISHFGIRIKRENEIHSKIQDLWHTLAFEKSTVHLSVASDLWSLPVHPTQCSMDAPVKNQNQKQRLSSKDLAHYVTQKSNGGKDLVLLIGSQLNNSTGSAEVIKFIDEYNVPCVTTLDAKGSVPLDHNSYFGEFGFGGCKSGFELLRDKVSKVVVAIGAQLNERNSCGWHPEIFNDSKIFCQISNSRTLLKNSRKIHRQITACPINFLQDLTQSFASSTKEVSNSPIRKRSDRKKKDSSYVFTGNRSESKIDPVALILDMQKHLPDDIVLFVDSGIHRLLAYKYWKAKHPGHFITAANTAPTGWAIGAAIGASFANPNKRIVTLTGDQCMLMHGNELATAARYNVRVTFIISDNNCNLHLHHRLLEDGVSNAGYSQSHNVSWVNFSSSMGIPSIEVHNNSDFIKALNSSANAEGPFVIVAKTNKDIASELENIYFSQC